MLSGIVQALQSGGRWGDCLEHVYSPKKTLYNRFVRWAERGCGRASSTRSPVLKGAGSAVHRQNLHQGPFISNQFGGRRHGGDAVLGDAHIVHVAGVVISTCGRPLVSHKAWTLGLRPPRVWPIPLAKAPLFAPPAVRCNCGNELHA